MFGKSCNMHERLARRGLAKPYGINGKRLREAVTSPIETGQLGFANYDEVCHGHDINTISFIFVSRLLHVPRLLIPSWSYISAQYIILIFIEVRVLTFIRNDLSAPLIHRLDSNFFDIRSHSKHIQVT